MARSQEMHRSISAGLIRWRNDSEGLDEHVEASVEETNDTWMTRDLFAVVDFTRRCSLWYPL